MIYMIILALEHYLAGGYNLQMMVNFGGPLSYRYAPANTFHRVELDKNISYCWTLFIPKLRMGIQNKRWLVKT